MPRFWRSLSINRLPSWGAGRLKTDASKEAAIDEEALPPSQHLPRRAPAAAQRLALPLPSHVGTSFGEEVQHLRDAVKSSRSGLKRQRRWWEWLAVFLPCVEWIVGYDWRRNLIWDLLAGCSVGFMVVPQGTSYATLAGVPSVWGLYGAFVPVLMYSVFGSSRQLAVGPVAVTSLLIGNGIKRVVPGSQFITDPNNLDSFQRTVQKRYNKSVTQLAFLVSILYTGIGILRLGFLIRFLSHPVTTGFTSGAAVIIALSQVKFILGYNVPRKDTLQEQIAVLVEKREGFQIAEFAMGMSILAFLITLTVVSKRFPKRLFWLSSIGPMAAAIIGIVVVAVGKFNYLGSPIKVVLNIPKGLPQATVSDWLPFQYVDTLVPLAFVVMLVDMLESTSIARALARKHDYKIVYNREIIGLGVANFFGAAFNAYTTTGSFSRSAVNNASGAKTQLAGVFTSLVVMFVLLFLTPVFALVPYNAIGAIIISGCLTLFEWRVAQMLWRTNFRDFLCWLAAMLGVCFLGVEMGLGVAIALSLFLYVLETAFPHMAILGTVEKTDVAVSTSHYPHAKTLPGILALRMDAPMYFGNVQYLEDKVDAFVEQADQDAKDGTAPPLEFLILDLEPSSHIDSSGCHTIGIELARRLGKRDIQVVLAGPNEKVLRNLDRSGVLDEVGREWLFSSVTDAFDACSATQLVRVDSASPSSGTNGNGAPVPLGKDVDGAAELGSAHGDSKDVGRL